MNINQIRQEKQERESQLQADLRSGRKVENISPHIAQRNKELRAYHEYYDKIEDYFGLLLSEGLIDPAFFEYNLARLLDMRITHYGCDDDRVLAHHKRLLEVQDQCGTQTDE